jgi:hypothetical protein
MFEVYVMTGDKNDLSKRPQNKRGKSESDTSLLHSMQQTTCEIPFKKRQKRVMQALCMEQTSNGRAQQKDFGGIKNVRTNS